MKYKSIIFEKGRISKVILNNPEKRNPMSYEVAAEIMDALRIASSDPEVKVVILRGQGPNFSSGHDLTGEDWKKAVPSFVETGEADIFDWWSYVDNMRLSEWYPLWEFNKALICELKGNNALAGVEYSLMCDIVIASEEATLRYELFRFTAALPTQMITYAAPMMKAKKWLLTGSIIEAQEAERWGLVTEVVPLNKLEETVNHYAEHIAKIPSGVIRAQKEAIRHVYEEMGITRVWKWGALMDAVIHASKDDKEGRNLFAPGHAKAAMDEIRRRFADSKI